MTTPCHQTTIFDGQISRLSWVKPAITVGETYVSLDPRERKRFVRVVGFTSDDQKARVIVENIHLGMQTQISAFRFHKAFKKAEPRGYSGSDVCYDDCQLIHHLSGTLMRLHAENQAIEHRLGNEPLRDAERKAYRYVAMLIRQGCYVDAEGILSRSQTMRHGLYRFTYQTLEDVISIFKKIESMKER